MPVSLPYLASNKNVDALFTRIASAAVPPKFNREFLETTVGLKSTNDRQMIPLMRNLGFLDQANTPTATYPLLKGADRKRALADGIRKAYEPLFKADEGVWELQGDSLKRLIAQIAGTDDDATGRIAATFSSLTRAGDFKAKPTLQGETKIAKDETKGEAHHPKDDRASRNRVDGLRTEFQYVIQVQLPSNGTEETYLNIFNAIRKTFQ
ncbi:DUF5343 domain-containing protein [Rhodopseudomonas sp. P1]|uniref:DUF5343 domain-containing protein n=1 Tax=Rhodopseudomonas sp. P1 TaxID=3434357 RepID=UPI0031FD7E74